MRQLPLIFFGGLFPLVVAYAFGMLVSFRVPMPSVIRFGIGAAFESVLVFLLLLAGWATWIVFLVGGIAISIPLIWLRAGSDPYPRPARTPLFLFTCVVFCIVGFIYFVNALAPEIQPDAITYHLGLPAEYIRLRSFPERIGFYEMLPQGLEMLFTVAFAFGGHSAAKLVHFAFLIGTIPALRATGRELGLGDDVTLAAAGFYLCAPVVGVSGTSAYNDAALVFYGVTTLYLFLTWRRTKRASYLLYTGFAAGFCYAVKITGLIVPAVAAMFTRSWKATGIVVAGATIMIVPWMARDLILTGNPVAPILNNVFPNPWFRLSTERQLSDMMRTYHVFNPAWAVWDYTITGLVQGGVGPVFLLLPLALLAWRSLSQRIVFLAAAVLLIPFFLNIGGRFLMPSLPFFGLAIATVLARWRAALPVALGIQAVFCLPWILNAVEGPAGWHLTEVPVEAALRIEPEKDYLRRSIAEYSIARMIDVHTRPGDRIFCLLAPANAYLDREAVDYWHSAPTEQLAAALVAAVPRPGGALALVRGSWPAEPLKALRFRTIAPTRDEWQLFEARLYLDGERLRANSKWSLSAKPNVWDAPLAFDGNLATFWRTDRAAESGMFVAVNFDSPQLVDGADLFCNSTRDSFSFVWEGLGEQGNWHTLVDSPRSESLPAEDLRPQAIRALRTGDYQYVLAPAGVGGLKQIGTDMLVNSEDWGVEEVAHIKSVHLFRILGNPGRADVAQDR